MADLTRVQLWLLGFTHELICNAPSTTFRVHHEGQSVYLDVCAGGSRIAHAISRHEIEMLRGKPFDHGKERARMGLNRLAQAEARAATQNSIGSSRSHPRKSVAGSK